MVCHENIGLIVLGVLLAQGLICFALGWFAHDWEVHVANRKRECK